MKLKVKKCPQCGFEARIAKTGHDATNVIEAIMAKSSNANNPNREKFSFGVSEMARISGCKKMTWCDPRDIADYDAMKDCPHCNIPLIDMPEEK